MSRGDLFWLVFVPEINRYTRARNLGEVEPMARDLIAVMRDVAADSFTLEVSVELPTAREPRRSIDVSISAQLVSSWPSNTWYLPPPWQQSGSAQLSVKPHTGRWVRPLPAVVVNQF